ncbi:chromate transporter [Paenibacillus sp. y28]|uniref:chromate transporter n=1 Tax=Paenibacillus sp. y28 TaxID=3129110 RepID=UPI00301A35CA
MKGTTLVTAKKLFNIWMSFVRISPATFGGGYAMIPVLEREMTMKRKWMKPEEMGDVISVAGAAPGGIAVNAAAFIGFRLGGLPGAMIAVFGITLPTFLIVLALSIGFVAFGENPKIAAAFEAIRAAVAAMIVLAAIRIARTALLDVSTCITAALAVALLLFAHVHPMMLMLSGLAVGIALVHLKERLGFRVKLSRDGQTGHMADDGIVYKYKDYFYGDGI